jgi:NCS1 family nucleobase:cation symporter-1
LSTLATNIAANIVSPANDFANLAPARINFRTGGLITGVIGVLIVPWKLVADPSGYIFTWLVGYSSLLGPVGGILIADYYLVRRQQLSIDDLYDEKGVYAYSGGFNRRAAGCLIAGIVPSVPGFLAAIGVIPAGSLPAWIIGLYSYAWFVGFFVAGGSYWIWMKSSRLIVNYKEVSYVPVD